MKDALQTVHLGKAVNDPKTKYEQANEDRLNENFRRLFDEILAIRSAIVPLADIRAKSLQIGSSVYLSEDRAGFGDVPPGPGFWCGWDATFNGIVDVTQRRCSAVLSSPGWYRVIANSQAENRILTGGLRGAVVDIKISTSMGANSKSEEHEITIFQGTHEVYFSNELSASPVQVIDKIRYNYKPSNDYGYIDIHFTASFAVNVTVYFTVSIDPALQSTYVPGGCSSVAASPSGEIIITEYDIAPYAQAGMIIDERTITTDASGNYNFSDFPRDKYTMLNIVPLLSLNTYAFARGTSGTTGQWIRVFNQDGTALASTSVKLRSVFIHNQ